MTGRKTYRLRFVLVRAVTNIVFIAQQVGQPEFVKKSRPLPNLDLPLIFRQTEIFVCQFFDVFAAVSGQLRTFSCHDPNFLFGCNFVCHVSASCTLFLGAKGCSDYTRTGLFSIFTALLCPKIKYPMALTSGISRDQSRPSFIRQCKAV